MRMTSRREGPSRRRVREVIIRSWDALVVDGCQVHLGPSERNLLFMLAASSETRIAKRDMVDAGRNRKLSASACRRRLGQRLGAELASLLVPTERGESYRLRAAAEVEAVSRAAPHDRPTTLRVIGRRVIRPMHVAAPELLSDVGT
jgi:hypothetical protein